MIAPLSVVRRSVVISLIALGHFAGPASVHATESSVDPVTLDPITLVNEMSESLKTLTYHGTFVHMYQGNVESMRILHANDNTGVRERMISLNGEAREVYRNNSLVTCIWPGSRSVIVSKSKPRDLLPKVDPELTRSKFYEFLAGPDDRVAGLDTYVVNVVPKDEYRYGYRFWIDKDTKMLLRSMLLDNTQKSLEQIMFTEISFPISIADSELDADTSNHTGYSWLESNDNKTPSSPQLDSSHTGKIDFEKLPWGYTKTSETYRPMPMNDSAVSHVMLSDGMASISVYVEYLQDPDVETGKPGMSMMGAMNAYGRRMDDAFITVVGEVPAVTVKVVGDAVKIKKSGG